MSQRRLFLALAASLGVPHVRVSAQPGPPSSLRRIGVLTTGPASSPASQAIVRTLETGLAQRGFVRGRDYDFELRGADNDVKRLPELAREMVALRPALVVAGGNQMLPIVAAADPNIVIAGVGNLVAAGLAQSLRRPGGRATGVTVFGVSLNLKRLELLADVLPKAAPVALLGEGWARERIVPELQAHARTLGRRADFFEVRAAADVDTGFAAARRAGMAGVCVLESPLITQFTAQVVAASLAHRLPTMYQWPEFVHDGALMGYGPRRTHAFELLAGIIARILRGTPPGEIPIEQTERVELAINRAAARAIGLQFPPALLARADEVVE